MRLSIAQRKNFLYDLDVATSFEALFSLLEVQTKNLGIDNVLYSFIPSLALDFSQDYKPIFVASDSNNYSYLKHYLEARFDLNDYNIKRIKQQKHGKLTPIDWWDEINRGALFEDEIEVMATARADYYMTNGITFPTLSDATGIAAVSFVCNEKNRLYIQLQTEIMDDLAFLSRAFHRHVVCGHYKNNIFIKPLIKKFGKVEMNVFRQLLLTGQSANSIADELELGIKSVEGAIHRLRIKLAGKTVEGLPKISKDSLIHYGSLMGISDWRE